MIPRGLQALVARGTGRVRHFFRVAAHGQLLPVLESGEETLIGGQAVMEGVMMRSPHSYCVAVRRASGVVTTETKTLAKVSEKYPLFKYPFLRGLGTLGQAMTLGYKALQFSANLAMEDEEAKTKSTAPTSGAATMMTAALHASTMGLVTNAGGDGPAPKKQVFSNWVMGLQLAFSLAFFLFAYKFVPLWLTTRLSDWFPVLGGRIAFNLTDGAIRIVIFLGFLYLLSRWRDIHRVFEYHGAEHKVVFNFESGKPLTVAHAQSFQTFHPRCGTSFLITLMIISIGFYAVLPFDGFAAKFASRIVLLPVIVGVSYEIIRFAARRPGSLMAVLTAPGLWLQRITTQPPSDDQAEVAIVALNGAMEMERSQGGTPVIA